MAIEIWLTFNNGAEKILFPVNPSEVEIKTSTSHKKVDVQRLGEVILPQNPNLKGVAFKSFFPPLNQVDAPYVKLPNNIEMYLPDDYCKMIVRWKDSGRPCRLIIVSSSNDYPSALDINTPVVINDFSFKEVAGDVGTAHFSISLTEYKFITTRTVQVVNTTTPTGVTKTAVKLDSGSTRPSTKETVTSHKVVKGDSLWAIGKRYNIPWESIATKNNIKKPYIIRPGQVLKL